MDVWTKRFDELYRMGIRNLLLVGGEPALRLDVLLAADKVFPYVSVITNGTIKIPPEFDHTLFVSVDGSEETNDAIRGDGVFQKVIDNYSGDKRVVINMTLMNSNYKELEDVVQLAREHGFQGVVCNICAGVTDGSVPMVVTREQRTPIIEEMKRVQKLYPHDFLMNKRMIRWFEQADHRGKCAWGDDVLHFDVSWNRRRCFAPNSDCSNCGCNAGTFEGPLTLLKHPVELLRMVLGR